MQYSHANNNTETIVVWDDNFEIAPISSDDHNVDTRLFIFSFQTYLTLTPRYRNKLFLI